ncbi:alpha/beta hydrolase [Georgenia satyanarayanai]|uniref:alpha/beta hydrolase n=1 Tax=Georgenia satyanarayanai TaxID=860221 RepID=UPI001264A626|nr:alpha/beta hydrolase [Georgenia satyanarayanai]
MARRRGLLRDSLLVLGTVLTAVGVGIGLPHLATEGVAPGDVAGGAALVLGIVLLLLGGAGLVRATPGWWRLATAPAVLVVTALAVYVLATPLAAAVPARDPVDSTPPVEVEEVTVPTPDGELLAGWFAPASGGAAVVLLPGAGSSRDAVVDHLAVLHWGGYGVLALDPRGHGHSTGRAMDWGWTGETDVAAAVDYLAGRDDVDAGRIAVVGLSMGGEEAVGAAGADERIRAVVAEGVTGRQAADLHWLSSVYGWRGAVTEAVHHATTAVADVLSPAHPPPTLRSAAAAAAPRPVLLVVAGRAVDEQHAAADIEGASPGNVTVWTVPGAGHTGGLRTDPAAWARTVRGFLDEHVD